jgi:hypothetical protein
VSRELLGSHNDGGENRTMKRLFAFALLCMFAWHGCKDHSTQPGTSSPKFAIYKLADTTLTEAAAQNQSLDSLRLSPSPFLTGNDIVAYYWLTHSFSARASVDSAFSQMRYLLGKSGDIPFVVVASNRRIYLGSFWWGYSSSLPQGAYILIGSSSPYTISREPLALLPDMRGDQAIHDALKSAGVLVE